jgi:hypothetical protein
VNQRVDSINVKQLKPFIAASVLWAATGTVLSLIGVPADRWVAALVWWGVFFLFSVMDLAVLAGLVASMLLGPPEGDRLRWGVRLAFLGALKVVILIAGALLLMRNHGIPNASLLSGLGTLIIVPLLGGGLWSFFAPKE